MCKPKSTTIRLPISACLSALIALGGSLLPRSAQAQCDASSLTASYTILYPSGRNVPEKVHFGDTITITAAKIQNSDTSFGFSNGVEVIVLPDGTAHFVLNSVAMRGGASCFGVGGGPASFLCPGGVSSSGATGNCGPQSLPLFYVVRTNDVAKTANFSTNYANAAGSFSITCNNQALAHQIIFGGAGFADGVSDAGDVIGAPRGCPAQPVMVITPCISITKFFTTNFPAAPPVNAPFGFSIQFS